MPKYDVMSQVNLFPAPGLIRGRAVYKTLDLYGFTLYIYFGFYLHRSEPDYHV